MYLAGVALSISVYFDDFFDFVSIIDICQSSSKYSVDLNCQIQIHSAVPNSKKRITAFQLSYHRELSTLACKYGTESKLFARNHENSFQFLIEIKE